MAAVRSFNSTLSNAGNIAFKRDLVNQGEHAVATVMAKFADGGALFASTATATSAPALNYSATKLPENGRGIPLALIDSAHASVATAPDLDADGGAKLRYVVDRLCDAEGAATDQGVGGCIWAVDSSTVTGGSQPGGLVPRREPLYRLSVRVTGPRGTQVFLQTSFSKPE
ncbi:MAG: hypothetical protein FWF20_04460 [Betaproteobacteria bacterium]|nr:hypothetical protein [Betaproteobacteria bacterium]